MKINYEKALKITFAGLCGIIGFTVSYWVLSFFLEPVEKYIENKLK